MENKKCCRIMESHDMSFNNFDLLAIGNVGIEHIFKVDRIPGDDKTGLILSERTHFGGRAGNIALTSARLGLGVAIASVAGNDFITSGYKDFLVNNHVNIDRIKIIREAECSKTIVLYNENGKMIYFFKPINCPEIALDVNKVDLNLYKFLYITAFDGEKPIQKIVKAAKGSSNIIVVAIGEEVYRKSANFLTTILSIGNYLFVNQSELKVLLERISLSNVGDFFESNERLNYVIVTLGKRGSILYGRQANYKIPSVLPPQIVNTLGAGDAYVAGFIYGLRKNFHIEKCGRIASVAASFVLEQESAQPVKITAKGLRARYNARFL
jgi:sugar/nucleoside kinase (ribokinase family)